MHKAVTPSVAYYVTIILMNKNKVLLGHLVAYLAQYPFRVYINSTSTHMSYLIITELIRVLLLKQWIVTSSMSQAKYNNYYVFYNNYVIKAARVFFTKLILAIYAWHIYTYREITNYSVLIITCHARR
jgi:hypothetical protein